MGKIILVIKNSDGKSFVFVTDNLLFLTSSQVIKRVSTGKIQGLHVVNTSRGRFVRSNRNQVSSDNLKSLTTFASRISTLVKEAKHQAIRAYLKGYGQLLEIKYEKNELIYIDKIARIPKEKIFERFTPVVPKIRSVAKARAIDPRLLTAILVNELSRMGPDDFLDMLGKYGFDTSIGLGQVKLTSARDLIRKGYYKKVTANVPDKMLYKLLADDLEAVDFAGAFIQWIVDYRKKRSSSATPQEIASDYMAGASIKKPTAYGKFTVRNFYPVADQILGDKK